MTAARDRTTVVGVFHDRSDADRAVDELRKAGFRNDQIGVVAKHDDANETATTAEEGSQAGTGALAGIVAGAGIGGLVGLGIVAGMIPVLGPVIAGGTLATILANAAGGAAIAGVTGALIGAGVPEAEADYYKEEFESGRTLVTVHCDGRTNEATQILRRNHSYDLQTSASRATTANAAPMSATATAAGRPNTKPARSASDEGTLELREEELRVQKTPVETGEVRVRKEVTTEHKTLDVPVQREEVVIERHPASGLASSSDIRSGEEVRIPIMEEKIQVDKQAVVKEEVTVGKRTVSDTERVSGDVRKESVRVEKKGDAHIEGCDPKSR